MRVRNLFRVNNLYPIYFASTGKADLRALYNYARMLPVRCRLAMAYTYNPLAKEAKT